MRDGRLKPPWLARKLALAWCLLWFGAAAGSWLIRASTPDPDLARQLGGPTISHWLGFDALGRDLLPVLLHGAAISTAFAALTVTISCAVALFAGAFLAMAPRWAGFPCLRVLDAFLAFPSLLLALSWAAIRGPGWSTLLVSLLIGVLPPFTRLLYARARELGAESYVLAARALGAGPARILTRHLEPELRALCAVKLPFLFAQALIAEATLSFLGVGAPIGEPTWGSLLAMAKEYLLEAPHLAIAVGIPLVLTVLSLQVLSEDHSSAPR